MEKIKVFLQLHFMVESTTMFRMYPITTPQSLKVKDKEIYLVHSESRQGTRYQVNFEDGTCTYADFKNRGETCKHFYRIVFEKAIA